MNSLLPDRDCRVMTPAWHKRQVDTRYVDEQGRGDEEYRDPEAPVPMCAHPVRAGLLSVAFMWSFLMVRVSLSRICHAGCNSSSGADTALLWPLRAACALIAFS